MFFKKLNSTLFFSLGLFLLSATICLAQTPTTIRGEMDDSATVNATEGGQFTARITPLRALHANLRNASGAEIGTASDPVNVEGTLTCNVGTIAGLATESTLATLNAKFVSGTDIGDVTINNASGASAVNVQDGGNSLTVDNSVLSVVGGGTEATAQRVTIANDSTGVLSVDDNGASLTVDGTIAATQSGTWNINNVSGTVSLPTGAATSANQTTMITALQLIDNLPNTLGSTTSGQSGALALGAVTTAAPSYTNAQSNALSLTTAGNLRVDGSSVTQPVSGTVTANAGTNLNTSALALESGGNLAAQTTALQIMDDWDETDRAKVNLIVGQAGVAAGAGAVGSTTQRMTLASNDPAVTALQVIDNIVSGSGVNISQMNGVAVTMGNGASGTGVQRVTIADDSTGVIKNISKEDSGTALTALNTTYDNTTTATDSADVTCTGSRWVDLMITLDSTNTPTDLTISAWAKDGSNYFRYNEGYWGKFTFDDTAIATAQSIWARFPCPATGTYRIEIDATGTDATNTFTVTNAKVYNKS